MPAYVVILREGPVRDPAEAAQYAEKAPRDVASFKMTPRALYGAIHSLEENPADGVALLEFPTVEDAKAWYHSDAYQAAAPHRIRSAPYRIMIVEGV